MQGYHDIAIARMNRWLDHQILYGFQQSVFNRRETMPEDVRRYFSLLSRRDQAEQRAKTANKEFDDFSDQAKKALEKVTQTGAPIVARMPNGDHYVMYQDNGDPTVEKVTVVNL